MNISACLCIGEFDVQTTLIKCLILNQRQDIGNVTVQKTHHKYNTHICIAVNIQTFYPHIKDPPLRFSAWNYKRCNLMGEGDSEGKEDVQVLTRCQGHTDQLFQKAPKQSSKCFPWLHSTSKQLVPLPLPHRKSWSLFFWHTFQHFPKVLLLLGDLGQKELGAEAAHFVGRQGGAHA